MPQKQLRRNILARQGADKRAFFRYGYGGRRNRMRTDNALHNAYGKAVCRGGKKLRRALPPLYRLWSAVRRVSLYLLFVGEINGRCFIFRIAAIGIIVTVLNLVLVRSAGRIRRCLPRLQGLVVVLLMVVNAIADLFSAVKWGFSGYSYGNFQKYLRFALLPPFYRLR